MSRLCMTSVDDDCGVTDPKILRLPLNPIFLFIQQCLVENHNVRVWTRSAVSVRGICRGYIVAFDKHFNLAMIDVDEVYKNSNQKKKKQSKKQMSSTTKQESKESSNLNYLQSQGPQREAYFPSEPDLSRDSEINSFLLCESMWLGLAPDHLSYRHVNQLFIRGDNVVCVNIVNR